MKLGILCGTFHPEPGGIGTYLQHFLPEVQARGHEVRLLTFGEPRPEDAHYGYPVERITRAQALPMRLARYFRRAQQVARWSDRLFVFDFAALAIPAVKLVARRPIITKVVSDWSWEMADRRGYTQLGVVAFQSSAKHPIVRLSRGWYTHAIRQANQVIVPSRHVGRLASGWGVKSERLHVIHNAIPDPDPALIAHDRLALRAELGVTGDAPLIVSVGRLTPVKGVDVMLRALPDIPDARFVVVGDGPQRAELEALDSTGRVTFVGRQAHADVLRWLRAADVYVLSSHTEGLSHTLLEAIAVGTPAIASAVGGNPEVITDNVNGLLIPSDNPAALTQAVLRVLNDKILAERLGAAGLTRSQAFRWDAEVQQTLAVLGLNSTAG
jgi:glycosyltransferase involved in cell wall biosynthesis